METLRLVHELRSVIVTCERDLVEDHFLVFGINFVGSRHDPIGSTLDERKLGSSLG